MNSFQRSTPAVKITAMQTGRVIQESMNQILAARLTTPPDARGFPDISAWENTPQIAFCSDWRNNNPDPERETRVQLVWSPDHLFLRYQCRYREIFVYEGCNGRRDKLWMRDVAEVFLRPDMGESRHYKEFEISPNGDWLDLDIFPGGRSFLLCDLKSRVAIDLESRIWIAELAIPFGCLVAAFNPRETWRLNLFRIEGQEPNRFYSAWQPTYTPQPNFHVPEVFGYLSFE
jgi:hypothetical protein